MKINRLYPVLMLLLVTLTAAAEDVFVRQGCRRGTPRSQSYNLLHRAAPGGQTKQTGGDFYHGERHQLTVLVEFNDRSFKGDETASLAQWDKIFNARNLTEAPFKGSVHDYFYAQSYGDFDLTFDLQYVKVTGNAKKYASTQTDDENSQYLVPDIINQLQQRDIDWSLYDWNGDGFVNQLLIIYAGKGMNDSYGSDLIWPHQWWMSEHKKDRIDSVYCNPIPVSYGGKEYKVDCYCALAELTKNDDYGSFGTICHEYTHCFGFPDFYSNNKQFVGPWELMDSGNYNGNGYRPAGYSAHERWLMGWLTPTELTAESTVTDMPALSDEPMAYLIRNDGFQNEYYIVENRQQKGWDTNLPGNGIIVFHIDYDASLWVSTAYYPNTYSSKHYTIFPANNITIASPTYSNKWPYPCEDNNRLTNDSKPAATLNNANTDGSFLMNKSLYDMTVEGGLASFRFVDGPVTGVDVVKPAGTPQLLYRLGSVSILRYPNGVVKKVVRGER